MINSFDKKNIIKIREDREPRSINVVAENAEIKDEKTEFKASSLRKEIEPWLTALLQSEHLSLLIGTGFPLAAEAIAGIKTESALHSLTFSVFRDELGNEVKKSAEISGRGTSPNIEDQIRVANELKRGLEILLSKKDDAKPEDALRTELRKSLVTLTSDLDTGLQNFISEILKCERRIVNSNEKVHGYLVSFLMTFASRTATRERLNLFTTNYDRIIELACELAGVRLLDRFVGTICPVFRSSRLNVDMHYNPPGIRGEPRYLEGVVNTTKLHGSVDWIYDKGYVRRISVPYGADEIKKYISSPDKDSWVRNLMVYPNAGKDRETSEYPYVELFRDLAAALCRPNSTLVTYGYSFGDEHINRCIRDMLTVPSTHLVIISYDDPGDRICRFYNTVNREAQTTLLIGKEFGNLEKLVDNYLPKPAIDKATIRMAELLKARGIGSDKKDKDDKSESGE